MEAAKNYATTISGATAVPAKEMLAQEHARRLHAQGEELAVLNNRLDSFLSRLVGPVPQNAEKASDQIEPNGVLYAAQFGATRIGNQIARLHDMVNRLESIA